MTVTPSEKQGQVNGVTGVILAGGRSSRMGSNKALLPFRGGRFIEVIHRLLSDIFTEVLLVTNTPEHYEFLPCQKVPDIYSGMGVLAGIHSGLVHSSSPAIFAVACDMPYLVEGLIRQLAVSASPGGVLIPESPGGLEPLHAVYGKGCLPAVETSLLEGQRRVVSFFGRTNVSIMGMDQVAIHDPEFTSFVNINTPSEYFDMRHQERSSSPSSHENLLPHIHHPASATGQ